MWIILKYYILQLRNFWKNLPLRIKIEITFLLVVFYVYVADKLTSIFKNLLSAPQVTAAGLAALVQHAVVLPMILAIPFIYFTLLPQQKGIRILRTYPLTPGQSCGLLLVHLAKYLSIMLILVLPLQTALFLSTGSFAMIYFSVMPVALPAMLFLFFHALLAKGITRLGVLLIYFSCCILYFMVFSVLYWTASYYILYTPLVLMLLVVLSYRAWPAGLDAWETVLEKYRYTFKRSYALDSMLTYSQLAPYVPRVLRPVLIKDLLIQIRNRRYLHLKAGTILLFILSILFLSAYAADNFKPLFTLVLVVLIWWHYGAQFNEKYVLPESRFFIKTLPHRYLYYVLAKLLSEIIYIVMLSLLVWITLSASGESITDSFLHTSNLFFISLLLLLTTIIFRTLFYEQPRTAGYAYHFTLLFCLVMTVNFYFIGPVMTFILLLYFSYKSYREFYY
jgi:hypothetical protein